VAEFKALLEKEHDRLALWFMRRVIAELEGRKLYKASAMEQMQREGQASK